ncbi:uncharacterized protein LOC107811563 [Nicotiana tabacum]|uniref:Gibberellin-regulated protein 14-like n=1 Tax=Nicotiana tabacum TaxID=4097 RepID=A0A1S4BSZ9_TOBAC|nr:PREDICTED: gibberellin-regulated protein 14-like [Nicotiana tabacum]
MAFRPMPLLFAFLLLIASSNGDSNTAPGASPHGKISSPPPPLNASSPTTPYPPTQVTPPPPPPPPPPPAKAPSPPPPVKLLPSPSPAVKQPPPAKKPPVPTPPVSPPKNTADCVPLCQVRCKLHSRQNVCLRACATCCLRCKCVPPGQYGNLDKCGKCYASMTTRGGRRKCP